MGSLGGLDSPRGIQLLLVAISFLTLGHFLGTLVSTYNRGTVSVATAGTISVEALPGAGGAVVDGFSDQVFAEDLQADIRDMQQEIASLKERARQKRQALPPPPPPAPAPRRVAPPSTPAPRLPPAVAPHHALEGSDVVVYGSAMQCMVVSPRKTLGTTPVCDTPDRIKEGNHFRLHNGTLRHADLCIDVSGLERFQGGSARLVRCSGAPSQRFEFVPDPAGRRGWGNLRNPATNFCLNLSHPALQYTSVRAHPCQTSCHMLTAVAPAGQRPDMSSVEAVEQRIKQGGRPGTRVLCWILTYPKTYDNKARAVWETWGHWCDKLLYMSSTEHDVYPMVKLNLTRPESRLVVWEKVRKAWLHVGENYLEDYDWFVKCDDDTVVMVDNLREMVANYKAEDEHFLGRWLVHSRGKPMELDYYSGGCGYVLSRAALRKVYAHRDTVFSKDKAPDEDIEMAKRLRDIGIVPEDTRDSQGRERWLPIGVNALRTSMYTRKRSPTLWYFGYSKYPPLEGEESSSNKWIATHYINPTIMKNLYFAHLLQCAAAGSDDHW